MNDKNATGGLTGLICLITAILVAGVATTILISTMDLAGQRAQETSMVASEELSSGIRVETIGGDRQLPNGTLSMNIQCIWLKVRLQPGASIVPIDDLTIEISDYTKEKSLNYYHVTSNYVANSNATHFTIEKIRDPPGTWDNFHYLADGVILKIYINTSAINLTLTPQSRCIIKFIPKHGPTYTEMFTTPDTYTTRFLELL